MTREDGAAVTRIWGAVHGEGAAAPVLLNFEGGASEGLRSSSAGSDRAPDRTAREPRIVTILNNPIAAGSNSLRVEITEAKRSFVAEAVFTAQAGETAEVSLMLREAIRRTVRVKFPPGEEGPSRAGLTIRNDTGEVILRTEAAPALILAFLPGRYTVLASAGRDRHASLVFTVAEADGPPVVLTLP